MKKRPSILPVNTGAIDANALRAILVARIYGSISILSLRPSNIERRFSFASPPAGTEHVDRYTFADIGGRGGTVYGWLLYPESPIGTLAVSMTAHSGRFNVDAPHHDSLINSDLLARGCYVLCLDQPGQGNDPNASNNPPLYLDGSLYYDTHVFGGHLTEPPSLWRVFLDQALGGINQAVLDLASSRVVAVGLSGGGLDVEMLAAIDTRVQASYSIFGSRWWAPASYSGEPQGQTDWEYDSHSSYASAVNSWGDGGTPIERHVLRSSGRRGVSIVSDADIIFPTTGQHAAVAAGESWVNALLAGSGSYAVHYDTTAPGHEITQDTCDWIWADVLERT
jgi:hypothetical protein